MVMSKMELPAITKGYYESLYKLSIRDEVGLGAQKRKTMPEKTIVEITKVKYLSVSVWGKTKEGWICMYMNRTPYMRKVSDWETENEKIQRNFLPCI